MAAENYQPLVEELAKRGKGVVALAPTASGSHTIESLVRHVRPTRTCQISTPPPGSW